MKKTKRLLLLFFAVVLFVSLTSCAVFDLFGGGESDSGNIESLSVDAVYEMAKKEGYSGTLEDFIAEFKGERGADGKDGDAGTDGVGIKDARFSADGHLILTLTNDSEVDCGQILVNVESGISVGQNGNWYVNGEDTGHSAIGEDGATWLTGEGEPLDSLGKLGDLYLDTETSDVYRKDSTGWTSILNIQGDGITVNEGDEYNITVNGVDSNTAAATKALMSAVSIHSVFEKKSYPYSEYAAGGSGVIYSLDKDSGDAYIITNYHEVYDVNSKGVDGLAKAVYVYLYGLEYEECVIPATIVGGAMTYDIAILKVEGSEILKTSPARAVDVASSADVKVLDTAIAIGNALGNGLSVTLGTVNVESEILIMESLDGNGSNEERVMRIDAAVNRGNSGGGVFNVNGQLIGIVNAKEVVENVDNMGYAIPSDLVVAVAENIIRNCDGENSKNVIKPLLGIMVTYANPTVSYDEVNGTLKKHSDVKVVEAPAETAVAYGKLFEGDIISSITVEGKTYIPQDFRQISEILLNVLPDSEITVSVLRDGSLNDVTIFIPASAFSIVK